MKRLGKKGVSEIKTALNSKIIRRSVFLCQKMGNHGLGKKAKVIPDSSFNIVTFSQCLYKESKGVIKEGTFHMCIGRYSRKVGCSTA